jgi:cytochrome b561
VTTIIEARLDERPGVAGLRRGRFDGVSILFHWTTVLLVTGLFAVAWLRGASEGGASAKALLTLHRSLGVTVWGLTAARLAWRSTFAHLPPFPASMGKPHQWGAKASEYGLYGLLALQPLTGLAQTLYLGRPFELFGQQIPALLPRDKPLMHLFHQVHTWGAWALLGLIGLHATAALIHRLVLRDDVFQAMLPWTRPAAR